MASIYQLREAISLLQAAESRVEGLIEEIIPKGTRVQVGRTGFCGTVYAHTIPFGDVSVVPDDPEDARKNHHAYIEGGRVMTSIKFVYPLEDQSKPKKK